MRKPHALTTSIVHPNRPVQVAPPPPGRNNRILFFSSPVPPRAAEGVRQATSAESCCSPLSSSACIARAEGDGPVLAQRLFGLLQLQLRASLLHTTTTAASPRSELGASSSLHLDGELSFGDASSLATLRRLRREVHTLGDVLFSHYSVEQGFSKDTHREASSPRAFDLQDGAHRNSDGRRSKERRTPVQLIPIPSDAEQLLLRPLQLDVAQQALDKLKLAERLFQSVASFEKNKNTPVSASADLFSRSAKGTKCNDTMQRTSLHNERQLFYGECARVAGILVAFQASNESDALALKCLAHVLRASTAAGAPVSVAALVDAVGRVKQSGKAQGGVQGTPDTNNAVQPMPFSPTPLHWCSCVPWLLHRYAATHLAAATTRELTNWPAASAWMTAAADRVCATQSSDLLYLSPPSSRDGSPKASLTTRAMLRSTSARLFEPWQSALDQEEAAATLSESKIGAASSIRTTESTPTREGRKEGLWTWLAEDASSQDHEGGTSSWEGKLRPYWRAVVREMSSSGAQAVDVLMSALLPTNRTAKHKQEQWMGDIDCPSASQQQGKQPRPSPPSSMLLKDVQFHAIGSFVSLRRITSSLQRHRRLVPLLQLHMLVSGYRPSHAANRAEQGGELSASPVARRAARHRHRVLTGDLMDVTTRHTKKHRDKPHPSRQVHQAGAMLWREVALLDAYTLITLGHVSEHAVDAAMLEKDLVLQQLAWLQQECIEHLCTLEKALTHGDEGGAAKVDAAPTSHAFSDGRRSSYALSSGRTKVLLSNLTPRTRATLMEKLCEGLRLSAKVLARWNEPAMICQLYNSYPRMGASWEVGRALLQRGHYEVAVQVLKTLLETPTAGRSALSPTLQSSSASAVRQLLLEAMQGAAAALVAHQQQEQQTLCEDPVVPPHDCELSASLEKMPATPSKPLDASEGTIENASSFIEGEVDAPLPAELRAQLHSLYTHSRSLSVPLPLCLHAVVQGLTQASSLVASTSGNSSTLPRRFSSTILYSEPHPALSVSASQALSKEQLRQTAVLCTYVLRCHLVEQPSRGLLSKTVELWASTVAEYLCRREVKASEMPHSSALGTAKLSTTDHYLREVAVRLLYGYPHLPVARLLLTRVLQRYAVTAATPITLIPTSEDASRGESRSQGERATLTMRWLLRHLFRFAGDTRHPHGEPQTAYPVCVPEATVTANCGQCSQWLNSDFTERYTQDTLRLMPQIALQSLVRVLRTDESGLRHVLERVQVALRCRNAEDDTLNQPWQCTTCYLWNGRFTSECKRCHTLTTALLQCCTCGFYTSSAGYRATHGLDCEVCGTVLLGAASAYSQTNRELAVLKEYSASVPAPPPPAESHQDALPKVSFESPCHQQVAGSPHTMAAAAGAATVTGTGRSASLFRDAPHVRHVVSLRPWTCTHCRASNDAHHVFFCRSCGHPPATTMASNEPTAELLPCGCCGHTAKTMESRLVPWCERCGALQSHLQELLAPTAASTIPVDSGAARICSVAAGWGSGSRPRRSPTLWWCGECAMTLNPWTRTHCGQCGAGRPAGAMELTHLSASHSASHQSCCAWRLNAAAPLITVPWSMVACSACGASHRVGTGLCWKCGATQSWPESIRQVIAAGWQKWLTQVTHSVIATPDKCSLMCSEMSVSAGGKGGLQDTVTCEDDRRPDRIFNEALSPGTTAMPRVPLLLPRTERWVCLRDGCMHLNATVADGGAEKAPQLPLSPVCCAACHAPRRSTEVFNPFQDRLAWRRAEAADEGAPVKVYRVVEALLLARDAPHPGDALVIAEPVAPPDGSAARLARVVRLIGAMPCPCACCGATDGEDPSSSSEVVRQATPWPEKPLFLVTVCGVCGYCSWGRSCGAYELLTDASRRSSNERGLLPGEEALALRLLLRSLVQRIHHAVSVAEAREDIKVCDGRNGEAGRARAQKGPRTPSVDGCSKRPLGWARFSRHVFSAVHLLTGKDSADFTSDVSTEGGVDDACALQQQCEERQLLRHTLLPWRGCDVASAQQLCSAEPRVAVLTDAAGTVHSALLDVRDILESICMLVELRMAEVSTATHSKSPASYLSRSRRTSDSRRTSAKARRSTQPLPPPPCLQDAWTRRLLVAALDLVDVVNASTVFDEIGFATLRRLCCLVRPHELDHIDTETKWRYLQEMKLSRSSLLHHCVQCERCLTNHAPGQPCSAL